MLQAVDGVVWSADHCSNRTYQLGTDGTVHRVIDPSPGADQSLTLSAGALWIAEDRYVDPNSGMGSQAALIQRNPVTGALKRLVPIGGDASVVRAGFGDLWVFDVFRSTLRRVTTRSSIPPV